MKTTYQKPMTDVIAIASAQIMAGSLLKTGTDENPYQNLSESPETDATKDNLSRRRSIWDDEEEEEEF